MNAQGRLRQAIDEERNRLAASVPADRQSAILALIRVRERLPAATGVEALPDVVTGRSFADLGGNLALSLCLETANGDLHGSPRSPEEGWDRWAERFLQMCGWAAEAELVLAHNETGFMRLIDDGNGELDAWIATKRAPASWRERADIDWWASWLAERHAPGAGARGSERPEMESSGSGQASYRRLAQTQMQMMAYQFGYPPDATLGGCAIQTFRDILELLISWALRARDGGEAARPRSESGLVAALAAALAADPAVIGRAVSGFTLDRENAAWHAAVPGVAAAPLVRVASDQLVWSVHGLTTEPLFFLTRELRRRDPQAYHNSAHLREAVFRDDLSALFADKRFVTGSGRIALRRDSGDVRTDIDAVVFDRKTGALGLFELKSQDPFARSTAELTRQRDNVLYANRQISGVLSWLNRYGGDALLGRVDSRIAKRFRVQKVYPFVLGRYLAHFNDGPEPDCRAAWGTWPQVLRVLDGPPLQTSANPIASLFTRLTKDDPRIHLPGDSPSREIAIGDARLIVHPSYAAFQARAGSR